MAVPRLATRKVKVVLVPQVDIDGQLFFHQYSIAVMKGLVSPDALCSE